MQQKPSFEGYGGVDYIGVREILRIRGVELTEEIYNRIRYVEDLYRSEANKVAEDGS